MTAPASPSPAGRTRWLGAGLIAVSAAGFSSLSIFGKLAFSAGLSLTGFLSLRFGGAALLLAIGLVLARRRAVFPGIRLTLILLCLGLFGYAVQASLFFLGLQRIPASLSALLLYAYPFFVALLNWRVNHRPPRQREWLAMALAGLGVALTVTSGAGNGAGQPVDRLGVFFTLCSAGWYAGYIVISDRHVHQAGALVSTTWVTAGAAISFLVIGLATRTWAFEPTVSSGAIILGLILFSTILPISTFFAGMARVGPTTASLLSTLEPVFTILLASLLLHERLAPQQMLGGLLVLAGVVWITLPQPTLRPAHTP
ncbi:MAG: DMT family transporter [Anaerolineales bacterium]|nr:DMT family transporter [Anaerolineales bacterium]